ncbi:hypothetical protein FGB62_130g023 [Gracilaria domingensis]|nr:hypothetical protein FGB62_130g023 [Gracilaria domingensis]
MFVPRTASYQDIWRKSRLGNNLDALFIVGTSTRSPTPYVKVKLNAEARVFLLLSGKSQTFRSPRNRTSINGLLPKWEHARWVKSVTGERISVGDPERFGGNVSLPAQGLILESLVPDGEEIVLPHPSSVSVEGRPCQRFTLLFARADSKRVTAFDYPQRPLNVLNLAKGKVVPTTAVAPNVRCPTWLHDLYLTPTRDADIAQRHGERIFWRTWHPSIDPLFWCYYDHEHGSYPGKYRPPFHYTAFKTEDPATSSGRQAESHNGFKVFSFALKSQQKFIVMAVHMQVSMARRFTTRFHTIVFAVLDKSWRLEAEVQMKVDFGAAVVTWANRTEQVISAVDAQIAKELDERQVLARRRFNLLNVDNHYPSSVDQRYLLHNFLKAGVGNEREVLKGIYEHWRAPLNSCLQPKQAKVNRGFNFDVRNPSTAMRYINATTDASMQRLSGDNVNRFLKILDTLHFGAEFCRFGGRKLRDVEKEGVFFTDPYFSKLENGPGKNSVRQFISPDLGNVELRKGLILPDGPWWQPMGYVPRNTNAVNGRRLENIEKSVRASVN